MDKHEEQLLLKLKGAIFDNYQVIEDELNRKQYISILIEAIKDTLGIEVVHFIVFKDVLKENEQIIFDKPFESLSILEKKDVKFIENKEVYLNNKRFTESFNKILTVYNQKRILCGMALFKFPDGVPPISAMFWSKLSALLIHYFNQAVSILIIKNEKRRYQLLQNVTSKLHSSIDMDAVLRSVLCSLRDFFPSFQFNLLLSNDNYNNRELPIELLDYTKSESEAMDAFLKGEYRILDDRNTKKTSMYFPLKGKQGNYGVLEIKVNSSVVIAIHDIEFISILAQSGGSAIENAHLYQQSKKLVVDLQLITKVSHKLNVNLRLNDLVCYIVEEMKQSFIADEVGIVLFKQTSMEVLPESTMFFHKEERNKVLEFVKMFLRKNSDSLFIGDLQHSKYNIECNYQSIMAEPLKQEENIIGCIIILKKQPYYFSFDTFKLFKSLTQHSSLAFTNSILREELEQLVITDYLTKLYSRNYLDEQISVSFERDRLGTFLLLDIDNFKHINDTYGHQIGDQVLIQIADIIKSKMKIGSVGARWGGEELAIYLPNCSLNEGLRLGKELVYLTSILTNPKVTISCGVSTWDQNQRETSFTLFKKADEGLYEAKNKGKNRAIAVVNEL